MDNYEKTINNLINNPHLRAVVATEKGVRAIELLRVSEPGDKVTPIILFVKKPQFPGAWLCRYIIIFYYQHLQMRTSSLRSLVPYPIPGTLAYQLW